MKNVSRERRKAERAALAIQAEQLEQELAARRTALANARAWRLRAHDEIRKRRLAESTNDQLQEALRRQENTLATLIKSFAKSKAKALPVAPVPSRRLHDDQGRRFAMLLEDVDRAFHTDLHEVFQDPKDTATDLFTTRLVKHHSELVLEARRSSVIVCELPRCCEALWTASEQIATATHRNAWVSRPSQDVVLMRLHASSSHGEDTWVATSSLVEKRFYEGDRMAIVWRAVTSIDNRAALADVYVEETGWTFVMEEEDEENECVRVADCVQTVPRSTNVALAERDEQEEKNLGSEVRLFTRHVMAATTAHLDAIRDRMENLLIDDCMREVET
jgi:hypothetical protein